MTVKLTRCIEFVPKRHAFKARFYNSVELKNWIDFGSVRGNFTSMGIIRVDSFGGQLFLCFSKLIVIFSHLMVNIHHVDNNYYRYLFHIQLNVFHYKHLFQNEIQLNISHKLHKIEDLHYFFLLFSFVFTPYFVLSNRILHAVLTQPEKDSPSFLACCWINSSKSSSNRIVCLVLFNRSLLLFCFFSCTGAVHYGRLLLNGAVHYKDEYHKKQCPEVLPALSRHLTQPLSEVMIMANSYDNAHLCARQSKLYKFYDLSTAQVVQTKATTEREARKNLGKQSLIFISRIRLYSTMEYQSSNYYFGRL